MYLLILENGLLSGKVGYSIFNCYGLMICGGNPHLLNSVFGRLRTETKAGNCKGSSFVTEVAYKGYHGELCEEGHKSGWSGF